MVRNRLSIAMTLAVLGLAVSATATFAQGTHERRVHGDSALSQALSPQIAAIFNQDGDWAFALTRENPLHLDGALATELRAARVGGRFNHIVATAWNEEGKYSAEYYLGEETLLFVYETFEYFETVAPLGSWRNFKGLASWERRSYFDGLSVGYSKAIGEVHLERDSSGLANTASRLIARFTPRPGS